MCTAEIGGFIGGRNWLEENILNWKSFLGKQKTWINIFVKRVFRKLYGINYKLQLLLGGSHYDNSCLPNAAFE